MIKSYQEFLSEGDDFLPELEEGLLLEDYGQQAVMNQQRIKSTLDRIASVKRKDNDLSKTLQNYSEKAGKTDDDIAKAVYQTKIASTRARKAAYASYVVYLQSLTSFYQAKANEIEMKMKASEKRKMK